MKTVEELEKELEDLLKQRPEYREFQLDLKIKLAGLSFQDKMDYLVSKMRNNLERITNLSNELKVELNEKKA